MVQPLTRSWPTLAIILALGVAAIILTNALLTALPTDKPSVTFSIVSTTPVANPNR